MFPLLEIRQVPEVKSTGRTQNMLWSEAARQISLFLHRRVCTQGLEAPTHRAGGLLGFIICDAHGLSFAFDWSSGAIFRDWLIQRDGLAFAVSR